MDEIPGWLTALSIFGLVGIGFSIFHSAVFARSLWQLPASRARWVFLAVGLLVVAITFRYNLMALQAVYQCAAEHSCGPNGTRGLFYTAIFGAVYAGAAVVMVATWWLAMRSGRKR